jgi:tripartite-type tricarboxylate transporter receptor subunit TctC
MRALESLALAAAVLAAALAAPAFAQPYPSKPVRVIVTYPPGGSSDLMGRILAQKLQDTWGQPVVVESKPGAAGSIGMEYAKQQAPDGYTFVIGNLGPVTVNPLLQKVTYDSERDFVPVSLISTGPNILVINPVATPVSTLKEVIDWSRAHPEKTNFGSSGAGSVAHLSGEMLKNLAHLDITHIAYKGGILSVQDLVAGHVQLVFSDSLPAMQFIKSGKLRAICVTGPEKSAAIGDVPPCADTLPGLVAVNWWGVLLPAGTPKPIVQKFHDDIVKVMGDPDLKQRFAELGVDAVSSTPEEFAAFMRAESAKYTKVIKEANIKID